MGKRRIKSRPGLFGMVYYYDENGNPIGKSRPGLIDGTRVYMDQNGRYAGKSRPGFLAKEVFTDTDNNHITSYDSLFGEVHYKNGKPIGHSRPGFFDSEYTTLEEEDECYEEDLLEDEFYEEEDLLDEEYDDDEDEYVEDDTEELCDDTETEEYSPKATQYTVVRNLQLFFLCIVICMVIAVVYAIIKFN